MEIKAFNVSGTIGEEAKMKRVKRSTVKSLLKRFEDYTYSNETIIHYHEEAYDDILPSTEDNQITIQETITEAKMEKIQSSLTCKIMPVLPVEDQVKFYNFHGWSKALTTDEMNQAKELNLTYAEFYQELVSA